jgi:hypothetical protein
LVKFEWRAGWEDEEQAGNSADCPFRPLTKQLKTEVLSVAVAVVAY